MLDRWLDALAYADVDEVLINVHHLWEKVQEHVARRAEPPAIRTVFEPQLLGTAGTLLANRDWVEREEMFMACNADNLTDFDLSILVDRQQRSEMLGTIAVFHAQEPSACGVVEIDEANRMIGFEEKPSQPRTTLANAGIYVFSRRVLEVLDKIRGPHPQDIGRDLMPRLVGKLQTVLVEGYFRDIGTLGNLRIASAEWAARTQT